MRILIVEDEALVAMMLEEWLQEAGHETLGPVKNLRAAMEAARTGSPDLALMDINLGVNENGVEIARALRRDMDVPSLYLTAQSDLAEALETGVGILNKPVRQEQLVERIAAIEREGAERER